VSNRTFLVLTLLLNKNNILKEVKCMRSFNEKLEDIYYTFQDQGETAPVPLKLIRDYLTLEGISVDKGMSL
jgi:hypothetical protein